MSEQDVHKKPDTAAQWIIATFFAFAFFVAYVIWPHQSSPPNKTEISKRLSVALSVIQRERHVVSAAWQDPRIPSLVVSVRDDGRSRDGLARTYCLMLSGQGVRGGIVHVIDANHQGWRALGKAWCAK